MRERGERALFVPTSDPENRFFVVPPPPFNMLRYRWWQEMVIVVAVVAAANVFEVDVFFSLKKV